MWKTPETSSLDARNLLIYQIDDFHKKEFEIGGDIQSLWGILDIYLQRLEPVVWFTPTENNPIAPLDKHTPSYRKARTELFLAITRTPDFDINTINTMQIDSNGILSLNYTRKTTQINIIDIWNNSILPRPSTETIQKKTHQWIEALERSMEHESYLGWVVIIGYLPASAITGVLTHSLYWTGKKWIEFIIRSIQVKNAATGKMETITLPETYSWTKDAIRWNISKILEKSGYIFTPEKWGFLHPIEQALGETKEVIRKMTYEEYIRERPTSTITRQQFEGMKKTILMKIDIRPPNLTWRQHLEGISKWIGKHAGELVFFPVFMHSFSKYQNTANALAWLGEMAVFTAWARFARYIPAPPFLRWTTPLLWWWAAVLATHAWLEAADATKIKWQYMFDNGFGSLYSKWKSYLGHLAGNLWVFNIAEYADIANKVGEKLSRFTWVWDESARIDIGIPRTELPIPIINWYLGTIPEMTWFQSNINLGSNPWDWMRGAMWRDIDDWNNQIWSYNIRLKRAIGDILGKYDRNESMFALSKRDNSPSRKEEILRDHLLDILSAWSDWKAFTAEKTSLVEFIIMEVRKWKLKESTEMIESIIDQKTSMMYIDEFFISKRWEWLQLRKMGIEEMITELTNNSVHQRYLRSILDNMSANKPIVADGKWEYHIAPITGEKLKRWIPSSENKIYQEILSDKTLVTVNFSGSNVQIERGQAFAEFLDTILEYKYEKEFLQEIEKWNKKGTEWKLL